MSLTAKVADCYFSWTNTNSDRRLRSKGATPIIEQGTDSAVS